MARFKVGDKVRVKPNSPAVEEFPGIKGVVGAVNYSDGTEYYVDFPGFGEIQFFANELIGDRCSGRSGSRK